MGNIRSIQRNPAAASAALERPAPPQNALQMLRRRLLDPSLDAQGVMSLSDAILALQRANNLNGCP